MRRSAEPRQTISQQISNTEQQVWISTCTGGAFISARDFDQKAFVLAQLAVLTLAVLTVLMVALAFALS
jgi:hypothetical protein